MSEERVIQLIRGLGLGPHPEGGHFREFFRSTEMVQAVDGRPRRSALTTIGFLLSAGQYSRWHRVRSDEIWHFYEGEPLELLVAPPDLDSVDRVRIGPPSVPGFDSHADTQLPEPAATGTAGARMMPFHAVPAGFWQAARPLGAYSLVGCTVAPGFDFDDFGFLADDADALMNLRDRYPGLAILA